MTGVDVEKLLLSKSAKTESCQDALQTIFSDMNRMRRSAPVRSGEGTADDERFQFFPITGRTSHPRSRIGDQIVEWLGNRLTRFLELPANKIKSDTKFVR